MNTSRFLCSHLVLLSTGGKQLWVNLEEIWRGGALLTCEEAVGEGHDARISSGEMVFEGRIIAVEHDELGWQVEVSFSERTPWSIEEWKPEHLLDPSTLK